MTDDQAEAIAMTWVTRRHKSSVIELVKEAHAQGVRDASSQELVEILVFAVRMARGQLDTVRTLRANKQCGAEEVGAAEEWLDKCIKAAERVTK